MNQPRSLIRLYDVVVSNGFGVILQNPIYA